MRRTLALGVAISMMVAPAFAEVPPSVKQTETSTGAIFVNADGMTLYTFDKDSAGKSACNGPCATNWPPLAVNGATSADKDWAVIRRDDGSSQWSYKGRALYTFIQDKKPGDVKGDGFLNNAWHIAKP